MHTTHLTPTLAQSSASEVLILVLFMIGAVVLGGFLLMHLRRRLLGQETTEMASEGLFDSLRRMREAGEISTSEYDAARKRIIERINESKPSAAKPTSAQSEILHVARRAELERQHAKQQLAPPGYDLTGDPLPPREP